LFDFLKGKSQQKSGAFEFPKKYSNAGNAAVLISSILAQRKSGKACTFDFQSPNKSKIKMPGRIRFRTALNLALCIGFSTGHEVRAAEGSDQRYP